MVFRPIGGSDWKTEIQSNKMRQSKSFFCYIRFLSDNNEL